MTPEQWRRRQQAQNLERIQRNNAAGVSRDPEPDTVRVDNLEDERFVNIEGGMWEGFISGREALALSRGGNLAPLLGFVEAAGPQMQGPPDPQTIEARNYESRIGFSNQNRFNRWLDAIDPAEELQEFLYKCHQFGRAHRREGSVDFHQLEGRLVVRPIIHAPYSPT